MKYDMACCMHTQRHVHSFYYACMHIRHAVDVDVGRSYVEYGL